MLFFRFCSGLQMTLICIMNIFLFFSLSTVNKPVVSRHKGEMPHCQSFLAILERQGARGVVGLFLCLTPVPTFFSVSWLTDQLQRRLKRSQGCKIVKIKRCLLSSIKLFVCRKLEIYLNFIEH